MRRYRAVRKEITDGDFLLFSGNGVWSQVIRFWTRQEFSHCGLIAWWNDRCCVLEAKEGWGVRLVPVSELIAQYNGRIVWYSPDEIVGYDGGDAVEFGVKRLGSDYSWKQNAALALGVNRDVDERAFNCSEYLGDCLRAGGLKVPRDRVLRPGDFVSLPGVTCFGDLRQ